MKSVAARIPDIPCCLLSSAFLDTDVLHRFVRNLDGDAGATEELAAPMAVLFLGQLAGRKEHGNFCKVRSDDLKQYILPLEPMPAADTWPRSGILLASFGCY